MKKLNSLAIGLALVTFAAGWYLGGSNDSLTITSSAGVKSYAGGYVNEQPTEYACSRAVHR